MKRCIFYCEEYQFLNHYAYDIIQSPKIYSVRSDPTLLPHCRGGSVHRTDILCVLIGAQYSPLILILLQTSALITLCFLSQSSQLQTTPLICETEPSEI